MEQGLFHLLVLAGLLSLGLAGECRYYLIEQKKTWQEAQTYCRTYRSDLATINSDQDMIQLQREAEKYHFRSSAWIGLYIDPNSWHWSHNNIPLGGWINWKSNQPDNTRGQEACVTMNSDGLWSDMTCAGAKPYMCFKMTNHVNFVFFSNTTSWSNARSFCRQYYTDLAYAAGAQDNLAMKNTIPGGSVAWIGLYRDSWKWSDQTQLSIIRWMPGQPDNAMKDENCGFINDTQIGDHQCSDLLPFFCQSTNKRKELITRVEVSSNQDVNDPAVNQAVLEKIQKKLEEHGLPENTTVAWRRKPDGHVFSKGVK